MIYEYGKPSSISAAYWSHTSDFIRLLHDELEPDIHALAGKLTAWLEARGADYPDVLLAGAALRQCLDAELTGRELDVVLKPPSAGGRESAR